MGNSLSQRSRASDRSASGCEQALLRLGEGVIPALAAVGCQVGVNAVTHCGGNHLGQQVTDHMGPVVVTVPAGIEH